MGRIVLWTFAPVKVASRYSARDNKDMMQYLSSALLSKLCGRPEAKQWQSQQPLLLKGRRMGDLSEKKSSHFVPMCDRSERQIIKR